MKRVLFFILCVSHTLVYPLQRETMRQEETFATQEIAATKRMFHILSEIDENNILRKCEQLKRLLQRYPQIINQKNDEGRTGLMIAARDGYEALVKLFIAEKAQLDLTNNKQTTALMSAAVNGYTQIVKLLIFAGAQLDLQDINEWTALMYAAANGHEQTVRQLISAAAHLDLQDKNEWTALMYASRYGHMSVAQLLIAAGADLDLKSKKENTAFNLAKKHGYESEFLKAVAASLEEKKRHKRTKQAVSQALEQYLIADLANIAADYAYSVIPEGSSNFSKVNADISQDQGVVGPLRGKVQHTVRSCIVQ